MFSTIDDDEPKIIVCSCGSTTKDINKHLSSIKHKHMQKLKDRQNIEFIIQTDGDIIKQATEPPFKDASTQTDKKNNKIKVPGIKRGRKKKYLNIEQEQEQEEEIIKTIISYKPEFLLFDDE